ncbi:hypothetical protein HHE02_04530 [Helicobacter heilmannii]|uniref:Uncharacterized protein n=1 Tax=Helicobacter heilmannii TaxID=35817 RepID=A0A0K2XN96_HELHE|nr:hypothetical protein BN341_1910 [Helicobacter heilmannii ASB1.4]CRF46355.1 hypothetical protein HHE014_13610 [Helicobacter heilmannii]CRF47166.1 hypothetical protein HHE02_04530 [Helicobacter heilmannii]CRF48686.1 hypothetical protein HHE03_02600 [Helicobacter heilmannii]CRF50775.1 hypothetical protein HHE06_06200 [Helicobacter heilmannii]
MFKGQVQVLLDKLKGLDPLKTTLLETMSKALSHNPRAQRVGRR